MQEKIRKQINGKKKKELVNHHQLNKASTKSITCQLEYAYLFRNRNAPPVRTKYPIETYTSRESFKLDRNALKKA